MRDRQTRPKVVRQRDITGISGTVKPSIDPTATNHAPSIAAPKPIHSFAEPADPFCFFASRQEVVDVVARQEQHEVRATTALRIHR